MNHDNNIYKLQSLIFDYYEVKEDLTGMIDTWNYCQDPTSDPGLQYEKECELDSAYAKVVEFAKSL